MTEVLTLNTILSLRQMRMLVGGGLGRQKNGGNSHEGGKASVS